MFSLLEKKNGSVSDMQQAVFNKISTNSSNGIVEGYLNDFRITKASSNTITIDKGMISVQGYRIVNDAIEVETIDYVAQELTEFQTILKLKVFAASENNTFEIISRPTQVLQQDNLFATGTGEYEVELCKYNMTAAGIADFRVTIQKLDYDIFDLKEISEQIDAKATEAVNAANAANTKSTNALNTANNVKNSFNDILITGGAGTLVKASGVAQGEIELKEGLGQSTTDIMSQKAVTDAISNIKVDLPNQIKQLLRGTQIIKANYSGQTVVKYWGEFGSPSHPNLEVIDKSSWTDVLKDKNIQGGNNWELTLTCTDGKILINQKIFVGVPDIFHEKNVGVPIESAVEIRIMSGKGTGYTIGGII